jgi:hypothetical protein
MIKLLSVELGAQYMKLKIKEGKREALIRASRDMLFNRC